MKLKKGNLARITLSAAHHKKDIQALVDGLTLVMGDDAYGA